MVPLVSLFTLVIMQRHGKLDVCASIKIACTCRCSLEYMQMQPGVHADAAWSTCTCSLEYVCTVAVEKNVSQIIHSSPFM